MTIRSHIRNATIIVGSAVAVFLAIVVFQQILRLSGNFHTVVAGQFYRSSQLSTTALEGYVNRYGLKTIINLRGAEPNKKWYQDERHLAESLGLTMIDFGMSATKPLSTERAVELIAVMKNAQKPILVHCLDGADRTGLVSEIYASQVAGEDEATAERQLTPLYGHFGIPLLSPTFAMDSSWEDLEPFFGIEGS